MDGLALGRYEDRSGVGLPHGAALGGIPRPRSDAPILDVHDLVVTYENAGNGELTRAVSQVSLRIEPGEFVTIVGLSGCGKSTFLSAVAGLIRPVSGTIDVAGKRVSGPGPDRAVVFQRPSLLPWRTVVDNIIYGLELRGVGRNEAKRRAKAYIELVQLEGVEHFHPHALSGGMQQRVNLARALVCDPALLLLDEPFAALDAITRETMQRELLSIWEKTRKTVLMVTHQIDEAVLLSDRVIVFSDRPARIVEEIVIDIDRPRDAAVRSSPAFAAATDRLWSLILASAVQRGARQ
jgi:NitT/TauT family transport system ATP-binding protein